MAVTQIGTYRDEWHKENTTTAGPTFGAGFLEGASAPTTNTTTGVFVVSPSTAANDFNNVAALFYATGSTGKTAHARVWGVSKVSGVTAYVGVLLGELTLTCGNGTAFSSYKYIKSISVDTDCSNLPPGIRVMGDVGDRAATLLFDAVGFTYLVIELVNDTGGTTNIGVLWRVL